MKETLYLLFVVIMLEAVSQITSFNEQESSLGGVELEKQLDRNRAQRVYDALTTLEDELAQAFSPDVTKSIRHELYGNIFASLIERLKKETDISHLLGDVISLERFLMLEMGQLPNNLVPSSREGIHKSEFFINNRLLLFLMTGNIRDVPAGVRNPSGYTVIKKKDDAFRPDIGLAEVAGQGFNSYGNVLFHERIHKLQEPTSNLKSRIKNLMLGAVSLSYPIMGVMTNLGVEVPQNYFLVSFGLFFLQLAKLLKKKVEFNSSIIPHEVHAQVMSHLLSGNEDFDTSIVEEMRSYVQEKRADRVQVSLQSIKGLLALGVDNNLLGKLVSQAVWDRKTKNYPILTKYLETLLREKGLSKDDLEAEVKKYDQQRKTRIQQFKTIVAEVTESLTDEYRKKYLTTQ